MGAGTTPVIAGALACLLAFSPAAASAPVLPDAAWILDQVKILSAPEMEGRASGTPGVERAARHIAAGFAAAGLQPGGDKGTFLQSFSVPTGLRLGDPNRLAILAPAPRELVLGRDFVPLAVSADGTEEADVVFAGYGITAPELGWDDYAGLDVQGKAVLVMTRDPGAQDPASPFRRPDAYHYSERSHKVINARERGARGVLMVPHPGAEDALPPLRGITQSWSVLAASVTRAQADALLAPSGRRLDELAQAIDRDRRPQSLPLPGTRVRLQVGLVRERGTAANVVGVLPGTDPALRDEAVVIGAHYDHLGQGGEGSLAPDLVGVVHPGADDNASGAAALLALARAFAAAGGAPRTLVFAAFAGEEMGLLGSTHYVRHPAHPVERTVLMVNLDMVGRLRDRKLYVAAVDSGRELRAVAAAHQGNDLDLQLRGDLFAPSDHAAFHAAERPVVSLFTGAHEDYHRPSDTWDKVNAPGLHAVTAFAARLVAVVAREPAPPTFVKLVAPPAPARSGSYGPYFGIVPDFGEGDQPGVRVTGVRPGSPAEKAGMQAGDVITLFAGVAVHTLEDLTFALRGQRPGDRVEFAVSRDGQERRLRATLEERRR